MTTVIKEDQPIYKANAMGFTSLTDAEVLAAIIGGNVPQSIDMGRQLLMQCDNDLNAIARLTVKEMESLQIKGLTLRAATIIKAALELGLRRKKAEQKEKQKITTSLYAYEYFYPYMQDLTVEHFMLMTLNRANIVIASHKISEGGLAATTVDIRIVLQKALLDKASSIMLCHNHPSGNLKPSQSDIDLTRKIKDAANLLEITLLDHFIVVNNAYYSFADEGML